MTPRALVLSRAVAVCAAIGAAVLLAGCTSGKSHPASSSPAASAPTSVPDRATLTGYLLTAGDLPSGWKASPSTSTSSDPVTKQLAICLGVPGHEAAQVTKVESDDFTNGDATVSSNAISYRTAAAVTADRTALLAPKAEGCFRQSLVSSVATAAPSGAKLGSPTLTLSPATSSDPSSLVATFSASIPITISGQAITAYLRAAFIAGPQVEAEVDFQSIGAPVPTGLWDQLVATVARRVAGK